MSVVTFGPPPTYNVHEFSTSKTPMFVYGVGGGGDVGLVGAFIKSQQAVPDKMRCIAVAAGYSLPQYKMTMSTKVEGKDVKKKLTPSQIDEWLELVLGVSEGIPEVLEVQPLDRDKAQEIWNEATGGAPVQRQNSGFKYGTLLDEYYLRDALRLECRMILMHTVAQGAKYLNYLGAPSTPGGNFEADLAFSKHSIRSMIYKNDQFGRGQHILLDAGGDIVDSTKHGRDYYMFVTFLELLIEKKNAGDIVPDTHVIVLGAGVDGHKLPAAVNEKLMRCNFDLVDETHPLWYTMIQPFIAGLEIDPVNKALTELKMLGDSSRATQLFLDARNGVTASFTEAGNRGKGIFDRVDFSKDPHEKEIEKARLIAELARDGLVNMQNVYILSITNDTAIEFMYDVYNKVKSV